MLSVRTWQAYLAGSGLFISVLWLGVTLCAPDTVLDHERVAEAGAARPLQPPRGAPARLPPVPALARSVDYEAESARILSRPLFEKRRRPPAAPSQQAARTALPRLSGTVIGAAAPLAIFCSGDETHVVVGEGATIAGHVVRRIEATRVVLSGPDGPVTVRMSFADPAKPPAPSPALSAGWTFKKPRLAADFYQRGLATTR